MTTLRIARRRQFVRLDSRSVNDDRLSFRARGVLAWLLEKPDDWTVNAQAISNHGTEGRDAIRTALRELETGGYLVRRKWRQPDGTYASEAVVYEHPDAADQGGFPAPDNQERTTSDGESVALVIQARDITTHDETHTTTSASADDAPNPDIDPLCEQLAEAIRTHGASGLRPAVTSRWRRDMRLLAERGPAKIDPPAPFPPERIQRAITYIFEQLAEPAGADGFCWADQVRSPEALRRHLPKILDAARRDASASRSNGSRTLDRTMARINGTTARAPLGLLPDPKEITA